MRYLKNINEGFFKKKKDVIMPSTDEEILDCFQDIIDERKSDNGLYVIVINSETSIFKDIPPHNTKKFLNIFIYNGDVDNNDYDINFDPFTFSEIKETVLFAVPYIMEKYNFNEVELCCVVAQYAMTQVINGEATDIVDISKPLKKYFFKSLDKIPDNFSMCEFGIRYK